MTIPPVHRSIVVPWTPEAAFRRFTAEIMAWWPHRTHSVGERKLKMIYFEPGVGGRIYEEHVDGRKFQWGVVLEWAPPHRVRFTWHPSRDESTAGEVELRFTPEGDGTRLELIHSGWERFGKDAKRARGGYNLGWRYVLNVYAGERPGFNRVMDVVGAMVQTVQRWKAPPGDPRDRAQGELRA